MKIGFKTVYRVLVLVVLVATVFSYRAEQQAQDAYRALQQRCLSEFEQLPPGAEPGVEWSQRCALWETTSELNTAMKALDAAQKPFLASAAACLLLLLIMSVVYFVQRRRQT